MTLAAIDPKLLCAVGKFWAMKPDCQRPLDRAARSGKDPIMNRALFRCHFVLFWFWQSCHGGVRAVNVWIVGS